MAITNNVSQGFVDALEDYMSVNNNLTELFDELIEFWGI